MERLTPDHAPTYHAAHAATEEARWQQSGFVISLAELTGERLAQAVPCADRAAVLTEREDEMQGICPVMRRDAVTREQLAVTLFGWACLVAALLVAWWWMGGLR